MIHTNYKELVGYSEELILNCILVLFEYTRDVKLIEGIGIVCSLSLIDKYKNILNKSDKYLDVLVSSMLYVVNFNDTRVLNSLKSKVLVYSERYIIVVCWLHILKNDYVVSEQICYEIINEEFIIQYKGYLIIFEFFNDLVNKRSNYEKERIGITPIIIFQCLSRSNVIYFLQIYNNSLHGGSITTGHKLNMIHLKLSQLFYLFDIYINKSSFNGENILSNNRYDNIFFMNLKKKDGTKEFKLENIFIYISMNDKIHYGNHLDKINKNILNLNDSINKINSKIDCFKELNDDILEMDINRDQHRLVNSANVVGKISANKKINLKYSKERLKNELEEVKEELNKYNNDRFNLFKSLDTYPKDLFKIEKYRKSLEYRLKDYYPDFLDKSYYIKDSNYNHIKLNYNKNIFKYTNSDKFFLEIPGNSRNFSTLNIKFNRSYSTKINFYIDSPTYLELQRIINSFPLGHETQLKIEKFLYNQGTLLLDDNLNKSLDINYHKLDYKILNIIKASLVELDMLIFNYRNKLKLEVDNNNNKIEFLFEEYELFKNLDNKEIISSLLGRLLRIISNNQLSNNNTISVNVAIDLTKDLIFNYYKKINLNQYENIYSDNLNSFIKDTKRNKLYNIMDEDKFLFSFGIKLIYLLQEINLIKFKVVQLNKDHKLTILIPNDKISDILGNEIIILNLPFKIPMIVKPKKYGFNLETKEEILGGYLLNNKEIINTLIIKNSELKIQSVIEANNKIYDMVNNISSVAFKINNQVLEFILNFGLKYNLIIDPNFVDPLEIKKKKTKLNFKENKILDSFLSKKMLEMNILGLAQIFKNVPEFFIPVRIDNRGRVYCMADYLNYQGTELAKSLLLFSKGEKIFKEDKDSINFLKIFGANCFGNGINKKSFFDRVNWVNENEENILNFRNGVLIEKAESKLLFIAFCFEFIKFKQSLNNNDTFYISYFPIQLDATCNGYQHLSLLTGDEPLSSNLNLIPAEFSDIPKDFYTFVGFKLNEYFRNQVLKFKDSDNKNFFKNYNNFSEIDDYDDIQEIYEKEYKDKLINSYKKLANLNIHRKLVKTSIMVKPYNASLFQMSNYIKDQFEESLVVINNNNNNNHNKINNLDNFNSSFKDNFCLKENFNSNSSFKENYKSSFKEKTKNKYYIYTHKENKDIVLTNYDLNILTKAIDKIIYTEFPKLKEFNIYLKTVAKICSFLNITITWTLPTGLNVSQYYVDSEAIRLKPFTYKKNTFNLLVGTKKLNKRKQIRALMPNLIHSLDASSLALVVDMFFKDNIKESNVNNFYSIHDCFAVTANNIVNLIKYIKLVYIKIYSDEQYLRKFDEGIINSIKLQFGNNSFNDELKLIKIDNLILNYPDVELVISGQVDKEKINKASYIIN